MIVSKSMAARARRLRLSEAQVDKWSRNGLIDVTPSGDGRKRAWDLVPDRRLAACALVVAAAGDLSVLSKRRLVDEVDRRGRAVISNSPAGQVVVTLSPDFGAAA